MRTTAIALCCVLTACGTDTDPVASSKGDASVSPRDDAAAPRPDGSAPPVKDATPTPPPPPPGCEGQRTPPTALECTGLYTDVATKQLAEGVREYAPAYSLWADGAEKTRWILLPPGETIDATVPTDWKFPVGTKVWKEFRRNGRRVETRLFHKSQADHWVHATYTWNAGETAAASFAGGDIELPDGGGTYHVPTGGECEDCHRGRPDRVLGFEQVSLGLAGATGVTLKDLVEGGLLDPAPARTELAIGDDGTGAAAGALGFLHVNCGITCHNRNAGATAYARGMFLRLDPTELDGRSSLGVDPNDTTRGQIARSAAWPGQVRIVPGDASSSLLFQLISRRGGGQAQMPPIASRLVDTVDVALVKTWIEAMPALQDGGKSGDGGRGDASAPRARLPDGGASNPGAPR